MNLKSFLLAGRGRWVRTAAAFIRIRIVPAIERIFLPHPYECFDLPAGMQLFHSTRFGDPGYCRLRYSLDQGILEGAEDGLEMGAFNLALTPVKLESLIIKIEEYMPFGRLPALIMEV